MIAPTSFFNTILGAKLSNPQWSWGAQREDNTVFLRVWQDQTKKREDGFLWVRVSYGQGAKLDSLGNRERLRHIAEIQNGNPGYAVMCLATKQYDSAEDGPRNIKSFNRKDVFHIGEIQLGEYDCHYAKLIDRVPVSSVKP
ncbi:MAG: hypothetical protein V7720_01525 [Halioglobus sp.]